jgi:hypothetical protein
MGKLLKENICLARCRNAGGWQGGGVGSRNIFFHRLKCRLATKAFPLDVLFVPNVARCPLWPGWCPESATKANPS